MPFAVSVQAHLVRACAAIRFIRLAALPRDVRATSDKCYFSCARLTGLAFPFPKGSFPGVGYGHPRRVRRGVGNVTVVPVPPFVRSALGIAFRRVLPYLLAPERRHVEIAPSGSHR